MLQDGAAYAEIIHALGADGDSLNEANVSNWKQGGHQDWLAEQRVLEAMRMRQDAALELIQESGGTSLHEATNKMATAQIWEALRDSGPATLQKALEKNPDNYVRLLNTLSRLTAGAMTCERQRSEEAERKAALAKAKAEAEHGVRVITVETLQRIEKELNLI